jgi:hypothetical protein
MNRRMGRSPPQDSPQNATTIANRKSERIEWGAKRSKRSNLVSEWQFRFSQRFFHAPPRKVLTLDSTCYINIAGVFRFLECGSSAAAFTFWAKIAQSLCNS